jgi:hypothetical protein
MSGRGWRRVAAAVAAGSVMADKGGAATLRVTGRDLVVNGVAEVPRGLFSVHAAPLSPGLVDAWGIEGARLIHHRPEGCPGASPAPFVLDCLYDRYQPALLLTCPDWESRLRGIARRHGEALLAAARDGRANAVEFWNEPYLNWATKPGVNYDGIHYNLAEAAPGAPVVTRHGGETIANLQWHLRAVTAFRRPGAAPPTEDELRALERSGNADYLAMRFMPEGVRRGEMFRWREQDYVAGRRWWVRDRSQISWWSGEVNREFYLRMAAPFAAELKQACPDALFVAGWGFHLFESNWQAWEMLHRPTLDALHEWLDGYGEHHYGVDPRRVAASYEIADAYMRVRWGRRIGFWNTEAGGTQDPERPDVLRPLPQGGSLEESRGAAAYFLRDVLTMLRHVPDKARLRCAHEPQANSGVPAAFRLLKPLRGRLLEVAGPDDGVWAVAARAPGRLTVVCFNGTADNRRETLEVTAPRGTELAGPTWRRLAVTNGTLDVVETAGNGCRGVRWRGAVAPAPGTAEVLVFALSGTPRPGTVRLEQHVGDGVLRAVAAGKPTEFRIALPAEALAGARRARVRWVLAGADAVLRVRCNGQALPPVGTSGPFRETEVGTGLLTPGTVVTFEAEEGETAVVGTASVILEEW